MHVAEKGFLKYYDGLPGWAKGLTVVFGGVILYEIYTIISKPKGDVTKTSQSDVDAATAALAAYAANGVFPTLSDTTFGNMSDTIVSACDGCTTDVQTILDQFKNCQNDADVIEFIKVFGLRSYQVCPLNFTSQTVGFASFASPAMSLGNMLSINMNATHLAALNSQLASQGITQKF